MRKKIAVFGKGDLAIKCSEWLMEHHDLKCIVPDTPEPDWAASFTKWGERVGVEIVRSGDYKDLDITSVDFGVSIFYGRIFKNDILDRIPIINLHNSPLPKYRGVRPINWALKNNEKYHGITIHKVSEGIDDGDVLGKLTYPIYPEVEEVQDVYKKALDYGFLLFVDVFSKIDHAFEKSTPQDECGERPTFFSSKQNSFLKERSGFKR